MSLGLNPDGLTIPNASPRRFLRGFSFAVMRAKIVGYRSTESSLRKACLVRVRHCVAHRTLATALGLARCRHGKMFALSSAVTLHLIFKVLPIFVSFASVNADYKPSHPKATMQSLYVLRCTLHGSLLPLHSEQRQAARSASEQESVAM